ncbi:MAG: flagellar biosynthesis anti-sigma factor FlgM [Syntrophobacteraceae bacterium]
MNIKKVAPYTTGTVQGAKGPAAKVNGEDKASQAGVASDRVNLSKDYQVITEAKKVIVSGDSIRTEKVLHVRTQLENRTYVLNPEDVASKMLDEIL